MSSARHPDAGPQDFRATTPHRTLFFGSKSLASFLLLQEENKELAGIVSGVSKIKESIKKRGNEGVA